MSEEAYLGVANRLAPRYAAVPGLQAKLWLDHARPGTYGAVYFWDDREAMERYKASDLFEPLNPNFTEVTSASFEVLENLTRATQPVLELVEARFRTGADATRPATDGDGATVAGVGGAVTAAAKSAARTATSAASKATEAASSTASKATKAASATTSRATKAASPKSQKSTKSASKPPPKTRPRAGSPPAR